MNEINKEVMLIAQEECVEVTQAISKVFRFGIDGEHNGVTNRARLEEEIGDLLCFCLHIIMEVRHAPALGRINRFALIKDTHDH